MTVEIRPVGPADADLLDTYVRVYNAVDPREPTSVEDILWAERTYPGGVRLLASDAGVPTGAASAGRMYVHPPDYDRWWMTLRVLPGARRRGTGSALWTAVSTAARDAGKTGFETAVSEEEADGLAFLVHRGYTVIERSKSVRLALSGLAPPAVVPPAGVALTTYAARPDLAPGLHAVALEAYADIPSADEPVAAGPLEEFLARDVDRPGVPADGLYVALDQATGAVIGWASLLFLPGSTTLAWHDMTAVSRAWRGRGVATALKRATIAWAIEHGLEALETGNDEDNLPMRAVNARLGYTPMPDLLTLRGPLSSIGR